MLIQQFLTNIALLAAQGGNEITEENVPKISTAEIYVKGDRNKYRITNVEYDEAENEFLLEVEEEG